MGRKWRQRPIACQSCRRRKIRCSRDFPCSNCTSRGIKCVQFYEPQEPDTDTTTAVAQTKSDLPSQLQLQRLAPDSSLLRMSTEAISLPFTNAEIQARLDKLETCITRLNLPFSAAPSLSQSAIDDGINRQHQSPTGSHSQFSNSPQSIANAKHTQIDTDAIWFGGHLVFKQPSIMVTFMSPKEGYFDANISHHLTPIKLIAKPYCVLQDATIVHTTTCSRQMCIFLPLYHEACIIAKRFVLDYSVLSCTMHAPTIFLCIQTIYTNIQEHKPVGREELLLFLSMIAAATYTASADDEVSKLFDSCVVANSRCATWVDAAFTVCDELKRCDRTSILCLQGLSTLIKVSCYMEGNSVRNRSLMSTSIAMARGMGFHRIDLPGEKATLSSPLEIEMARRIWWDNVIIDWLIALFPGPHEGVYTILPQQMAVNKPSPVKDSVTNEQTGAQGLDSDITYCLWRIRLAEIGREFIDGCPLSQSAAHELKHKKLSEYNNKLVELQRSLPSYFTLRSPDEAPSPDSQSNSSLVLQRIHINCLIYVERCIVHLRFLSLASIDARYAFSSDVCFSCARDIVWMAKVVWSDYHWLIPRLRATLFLRTVLLASCIFLLDLCSGTQIRDLTTERPEMLDAWQFLGEMQESSNLIDQFLEFASQMMKKYHVADSVVMSLAQALSPGIVEMPQPPPPPSASEAYSVNSAPLDGTTASQGVPMDATQRWQSLDTDFDIKTMSWDNVLWGFDTILM